MSPFLPSTLVIIPTLNEAAGLAATLSNVRQCLPGVAIVVVDGGSRDTTTNIASAAGVQVIHSTRGRGIQCQNGAEGATAELLLFLHADTLLPVDAAAILAAHFSRSEVKIGTFRLAFNAAGPFLRTCAWCSRFDSVFTRFGDQGIAIRSNFYRRLGGFPAWPLFEDVELLRQARRVTRIWSFPASVTTSARRFHERGPLRQQWLNAQLLCRFLGGAAPEQLAAEYSSSATPAPTTLPS